MRDPNFFLFFVDRPVATAAFYKELFGKEPIETSPTFTMFALESGVNLGFWSRHTAEPLPTTGGGGSEIAIAVGDRDTVDALYTEWGGKGVRIAQKPVELDFGYTFVALDPDGHRIRVFVPSPG